VLKAPRISLGTFYQNFDSLHSAMEAVGEQVGDDLQNRLIDLCRDIKDPLLLTTMSFQAVLTRASLDPLWGLAFGRGFPQVGQVALRKELLRGRKMGLFHFADVDAAMALHIGLSLQAVKILETSTPGQSRFIEELALIHLRGLGTPSRRASGAVRWVSDKLQAETSKMPKWLAVGPGDRKEAPAIPPRRGRKRQA